MGTGLRQWAETTSDSAVIRFYDADRADELEAIEAPLLARNGFRAIAREEHELTRRGVTGPWVLFAGLLPRATVTISVRAVCYAKP
jgi:hypothetical protein